MKSINQDKENQNIDPFEIYAIVYLLEKNLFLKDFKIDQRVNKINTQNNFKRREEDRYNDLNLIPQTHQEMLLRSGIDAFNKKDKDRTSSLIDKYV